MVQGFNSYVIVHCDSQSVVFLSKNQTYHDRTKHIDVKFHFIWDILSEGKICLQKISTEENTTVICSLRCCLQENLRAAWRLSILFMFDSCLKVPCVVDALIFVSICRGGDLLKNWQIDSSRVLKKKIESKLLKEACHLYTNKQKWKIDSHVYGFD